MSSTDATKYDYVSELVPVTDWIPSTTCQEFAQLRRVFIQTTDDNRQYIFVLMVCVDHRRTAAFMYSHSDEDPSIEDHMGEIELSNFAHGAEAGPITDEILADLMNQVIWYFVPILYEDSITPSIVARARAASEWTVDQEFDAEYEDDDCDCAQCS